MRKTSSTSVILALVLFVFSTGTVRASTLEEKFWVFFTDKGIQGSVDLQSALEELAESYNPRAIQRREFRRTAPGLFDEHDLPLRESYVDAVLASGATLYVRSRWLNAASVRATKDQLAEIKALACVRKIRRVRRAKRVLPSPGETPLFSAYRDFYGRAQNQLEQIGVPQLHALGYTGSGVVIGMLDTGFHLGHIAFNEPGHELTVIAEWDFVNDDPNTDFEPGDPEDQHGHGTRVLATIGAYLPEELVGSAYDASFILAKVEDTASEYPLEEDWFTAGLEFIEANGGDVATSSLAAFWYEQEDLDGETSVMTQAFNIATSNGLHCFQAAGNEGHDADPSTSHLVAPADAFEVLSIGAVDEFGVIAPFSSDGPTQDGRVKPELLAQGRNAWTIDADDDTGYQLSGGTSIATPQIAGAVACIVQAHANWSVQMMRERLMHTADHYLAWGGHDPLFVLGYGIIDAELAADLSTAVADGDLQYQDVLSRPFPNPFNPKVRLSFSLGSAGPVRLTVFDTAGRQVAALLDGPFGAGEHTLDWDATGLASGVFLVRLETASGIQESKLTLLR